MVVGGYQQFQRKFPKGGVEARLWVEKSSPSKIVASVDFVDGQGHLVARLSNVEWTADAGLKKALLEGAGWKPSINAARTHCGSGSGRDAPGRIVLRSVLVNLIQKVDLSREVPPVVGFCLPIPGLRPARQRRSRGLQARLFFGPF